MPTFQVISAADARVLLDANRARLVDIRDPQSFEEAHIDGAQRLDNTNIDAYIATADKALPLIVVCYHGISSQHAAQFLAGQGFAEVYSLTGGFEGWRHAFGGAA